MADKKTVERTARTEFILRDERVRPGQIVTLNSIELAKYARAECVYEDEALNADVPVDEMPENQPAPTAEVPGRVSTATVPAPAMKVEQVEPKAGAAPSEADASRRGPR